MKAAVKNGQIEAYVSSEKDIEIALRHGYDIYEFEMCPHCNGIGKVITTLVEQSTGRKEV